MTKPLNTQNEWIILTLIRAVAGLCLVSLDVKQKYTNQSHESIKCAKKSILPLLAEANIHGLQVRNKNKLIKVKSQTSPLLQIHMHHQMCNLALIQNQYAPPNVESPPYSNSTCTTCQDLNQGPSACKLSVQTSTPPSLDTIIIAQQAIILPR